MTDPQRNKHGWPTTCVVCKAATVHESTHDYALYRCGGQANRWGWIAGDYRCDELKAVNQKAIAAAESVDRSTP